MELQEKLDRHREMARATYEPQMTAYKTKGRILLPGAWTADAKAREPWTLTIFGPMIGEKHKTIDGSPETMECTKEYRMYWAGFPDFRITNYKVWPNEEGWIARLEFGGTAPDGATAKVHQVDIMSVDEDGCLVRVEWFVDLDQWRTQVWSKASGKSVEELRTFLAQPNGFEKLIEYTLSRNNA